MESFIKKTFKKSTPQERERIKNLYKNGYLRSEIARICNRDRSTIIYWTKNLIINSKEKQIRYKINNNLNQRSVDKQGRIDVLHFKKSKELRQARKRQLRKENRCQRCYKEQEKKWIKTNWCSLTCWDLSRKRINRFNVCTF